MYRCGSIQRSRLRSTGLLPMSRICCPTVSKPIPIPSARIKFPLTNQNTATRALARSRTRSAASGPLGGADGLGQPRGDHLPEREGGQCEDPIHQAVPVPLETRVGDLMTYSELVTACALPQVTLRLATFLLQLTPALWGFKPVVQRNIRNQCTPLKIWNMHRERGHRQRSA